MNEVVLTTLVDEQDAWRVLKSKAPQLHAGSARLLHHPFAGFQFQVPQPARRQRAAHVLVDYYSGKAFLSDPWRLEDAAGLDLAKVKDPKWNTIDFETARHKAAALVRTASMRKAKLAWRGGVKEQSCVRTVWKPNWMLQARIADQDYRIMVDGLNGGYFVVGG
ncbi:hypothetical protein [Arthrobacter sp. JCM 19049]|uniref:hypothetical protein n=1 Tax=Arthrobacter sp. JCM 19049 TaxID=1460643 RepID=UPI000AA54772|nr:hypothetical protein [Arthrobacter sp. JCM 19049]